MSNSSNATTTIGVNVTVSPPPNTTTTVPSVAPSNTPIPTPNATILVYPDDGNSTLEFYAMGGFLLLFAILVFAFIRWKCIKFAQASEDRQRKKKGLLTRAEEKALEEKRKEEELERQLLEEDEEDEENEEGEEGEDGKKKKRRKSSGGSGGRRRSSAGRPTEERERQAGGRRRSSAGEALNATDAAHAAAAAFSNRRRSSGGRRRSSAQGSGGRRGSGRRRSSARSGGSGSDYTDPFDESTDSDVARGHFADAPMLDEHAITLMRPPVPHTRWLQDEQHAVRETAPKPYTSSEITSKRRADGGEVYKADEIGNRAWDHRSASHRLAAAGGPLKHISQNERYQGRFQEERERQRQRELDAELGLLDDSNMNNPFAPEEEALPNFLLRKSKPVTMLPWAPVHEIARDADLPKATAPANAYRRAPREPSEWEKQNKHLSAAQRMREAAERQLDNRELGGAEDDDDGSPNLLSTDGSPSPRNRTKSVLQRKPKRRTRSTMSAAGDNSTIADGTDSEGTASVYSSASPAPLRRTNSRQMSFMGKLNDFTFDNMADDAVSVDGSQADTASMASGFSPQASFRLSRGDKKSASPAGIALGRRNRAGSIANTSFAFMGDSFADRSPSNQASEMSMPLGPQYGPSAAQFQRPLPKVSDARKTVDTARRAKWDFPTNIALL